MKLFLTRSLQLVLSIRICLSFSNNILNSRRSMSSSSHQLLSNLFALADVVHIPNVLAYRDDKYDGVIIDHNFLPESVDEFISKLQSSLIEWKHRQRRGIWLSIPMQKSEFIPYAVKEGFVFHHAEKDYLMMTHWISEEENRMPPNASHQVGVGCVCISKEDNKILLVQERNGPLKNLDVWKLPTGLVDVGEDIAVAACREVLEETGIETAFKNLLCIRQSHHAQFGKSDLFFVCILEPKTSKITHQPSEILACEWKDPKEYFEQTRFQSSELYSKINSLIREEISTEDNRKSSLIVDDFEVGFRPGTQSLYYHRHHET